MWCILPMVYLLYNHCIFFLHLQLELIIKIKLSIVTITPLWSGLIKVRSGLVDRPTQVFYIWIFICCVNTQI